MTTYPLLNSENNEDEPMLNLAEPLVEVRPPANVHIVRQPLLNTDMEVYAYDLLYGEVETSKDTESNETSQGMLNAFLDIGLKVISEDCLSVIAITEDFLHGRLPVHFPPIDVVQELPSTRH
jgi:c-di-GMP-related signal transduction protein